MLVELVEMESEAERAKKASKGQRGEGEDASSQEDSEGKAEAETEAETETKRNPDADPFWPPPFAPLNLPSLIRAEQARNPNYIPVAKKGVRRAALSVVPDPASPATAPGLGDLEPLEASLAAVKPMDDTFFDAQAVPALDSPLWRTPQPQ